jgi:hypothetical protein
MDNTDYNRLDGITKRYVDYKISGLTFSGGGGTGSGTSGSSGSSGTSGTSGISGSSGTSGTRGTSGVSGSSGTSGISGSSGSSGTSGTRGTSGISGSAGTSGTSGTSPSGSTASGVDGASTFRFRLDSISSGNNPGNGNFTIDAPTTATASIMYISRYDNSGNDVQTWITTLLSNYTTQTTYVQLHQPGTTNEAVYQITGYGAYSGGSWFSFDLSLLGGGGTYSVNSVFSVGLIRDGASGTSGISGSSGTSGTRGTSGTSGLAGSSGTSGQNGTSGTSGTSGSSGLSGSSGTSGSSGLSGSSGTSGQSGTSGSSGSSGSSGTSPNQTLAQTLALGNSAGTYSIQFPAGSQTLPSVTIQSNLTTGLYAPTTAQLAVTNGGTQTVIFSNAATYINNRIYSGDGTVALPQYTFASDTNTGIYRPAADSVGISVGGSGNLIVDTLRVTVPTGSIANPSLVFSGENTTGISRPAPSQIGISTGGVSSALFTTDGIRAANGALATPGISFQSETTTGFYTPASGRIGIVSNAGFIAGFKSNDLDTLQIRSVTGFTSSGGLYQMLSFADGGGAGKWKFNFDTNIETLRLDRWNGPSGFQARGMDFATSSITIFGGGSTSSLFTTTGIRVPDGSFATPSISFINDTDTGIYLAAANVVGVGAGGAEIMRIGGNTTLSTGTFRVPNGSVSAPTYTFTNYSNTGLYTSVGELLVAVGGVNSFTVNQNSAGFRDGNLAPSPGLYFLADTDTGLFRAATNVLGVAAGGVTSSLFTTDGIDLPDGTSATPSISFISDTDTGFNRLASGRIGVISNGLIIAGFLDAENSLLQTRGHFANANGVYYHYSMATSGSESRIKLGVDSDGVTFRLDGWSGGAFARKLYQISSATHSFHTGGATAAQFDNNTTTGQTRFLLYDTTSNTIKRVSIGATDSGGTGFKVLRVPN